MVCQNYSLGSTILGGSNITATSADKTYVSSFVITNPSNSGSTGTKGTVAYDANALYVCTTIDVWIKTTGLTSFYKSIYKPIRLYRHILLKSNH